MQLKPHITGNAMIQPARHLLRRLRISASRAIPRVRVPRFVTRSVEFLASAAELTWRVPLIAASAAMLLGGILHSNGQQRTSQVVVTAAIAIAMLAIPLGLLGLKAPRRSVELEEQRPATPRPPQALIAKAFPPPPPARHPAIINLTSSTEPVATKQGVSA
jgi:hypothetical protein